MNHSSRVVLLGPPGSGKSTQARLLWQWLGLGHLCVGDVVREVAAGSTPLGRVVERLVASGALLPDTMVLDLLREPLRALQDSGTGFVIDGFPRTLAQCVVLERVLAVEPIDLAVELSVPPAATVSRVGARARDDDALPVLRRRLESYQRETRPVIEFYRDEGKLVRLDGDQPVHAVHRAIVNRLDRLVAAHPA